METNEQLLARLAQSIDDCANTLANPTSTRKTLMSANDKVLGIVSACNLLVQGRKFTDDETRQFHYQYDRSANICGRTRRFASLMKWEDAKV
jgi:hypothetical protein